MLDKAHMVADMVQLVTGCIGHARADQIRQLTLPAILVALRSRQKFTKPSLNMTVAVTSQ